MVTLSFTKQDLYTLLLGLAAAVFVTLGEGLMDSTAILADPVKWGTNLGVGILSAAGRYIVTEITQRTYGAITVKKPVRRKTKAK